MYLRNILLEKTFVYLVVTLKSLKRKVQDSWQLSHRNKMLSRAIRSQLAFSDHFLLHCYYKQSQKISGNNLKVPQNMLYKSTKNEVFYMYTSC